MDTSFPILYSFRRCPYAMRARLALYSAKIKHEHREVDLKNKPIEMLKISPKGTVPVLQVGETILEQSLDIMKWALHISHLSLEDTELISENDTTFKQSLDRYKYPDRYPDETGISYRVQCEQFLRKVEDQLCSNLTRTTLSIADMVVFPFIRQFVMVDSDWFSAQEYFRLKSWLDSFSSSTLFNQVMQRYPLWSPVNQPILVTFSPSD